MPRSTLLRLVLLIISIPIITADGIAAAADQDCLRYGNVAYIAIDVLGKFMGHDDKATAQFRGIRISAGGREWEFANGGDRIIDSQAQVHVLRRPVLVINGRVFAPAQECAPILGYRFEELPPKVTLTNGPSKLTLTAEVVDSPYETHTVEQFRVSNEVVHTTRKLTVRCQLHPSDQPVVLDRGAKLLIRRRFSLDGNETALVTDTDTLKSYAIGSAELDLASEPSHGDATRWARTLEWFRDRAKDEAGLRAGQLEHFDRKVCVTVDLCWSLRAFEREFFNSLVSSSEPQSSRSILLFTAGRWIDQHPNEMHELIELSRKSGVNVTWGLHSWTHPKSDGFMNDLSPDEVRADTLKVEQSLLRWGIVPTVFYRFPGLIHDYTRLKCVLDLNVLPIDCDAWLAVIGSGHKYGNPVGSGSVILIHGNGNEPMGIEAIRAYRDRKWIAIDEVLLHPR